MRKPEAEQRMKLLLDAEVYQPPADGWEKLQASLTEKKNGTKRSLLIGLPAGIKAAASVFLLAGAGLLFYLTNNRPATEPAVAGTVAKELPETEKPYQAQLPVQSGAVSGLYKKLSRTPPKTSKTAENALLPQPQQEQPAVATDTPNDDVNTDNNTVTIAAAVNPVRPKMAEPDFSYRETDGGRTNKLNLGVAAQAGKASVGDMQYQLGITASKNLSSKIFVVAAVTLASTRVTTTQEKTFPAVTVNSTLATSVHDNTVSAQYADNILSVGISPAFGYRLNPSLSLACGIALFRNLNTSLALHNDASIAPAALSNDVIDREKEISRWDAGLTGSAACKVTRRLNVQLQYRYGLSTYMQTDNRSIRNSSFGAGISYSFGRNGER